MDSTSSRARVEVLPAPARSRAVAGPSARQLVVGADVAPETSRRDRGDHEQISPLAPLDLTAIQEGHRRPRASEDVARPTEVLRPRGPARCSLGNVPPDAALQTLPQEEARSGRCSRGARRGDLSTALATSENARRRASFIKETLNAGTRQKSDSARKVRRERSSPARTVQGELEAAQARSPQRERGRAPVDPSPDVGSLGEVAALQRAPCSPRGGHGNVGAGQLTWSRVRNGVRRSIVSRSARGYSRRISVDQYGTGPRGRAFAGAA